ncbi:fimbria/pilus periplasmic chaperone [Bdellovibrio bacteriovorus]|nr:fimbria/pilus periplasmic chaperone [Bdellovibrio bacteriovorus]
MNMFKNILALIVGFAVIPSVAFAFRLTPMVVHFSPTGTKATQVLTLENPSTEKVPIQIEVFTRTTDSKGEEVRTKTDEFNVYPEQVVLLPNEKRNVRVTWSGEINGSDEKAFRIIASQLPVEFRDRNAKPKTNGVNLNFLLQYVASAYVTPEGAVAKVKVKEVKALDKKKISVTVSNEGSAHFVLKPKALRIYSGESLVGTISPVTDLENTNLLPKTEKTVVLTSSKEISGKTLRGELELAESGD